jgi:hypothetical protein
MQRCAKGFNSGVKVLMNNVMDRFLIHLSIYFCLAYFGLSFSPSSETSVQFRRLFKYPVYGISARAMMEHNVSHNYGLNEFLFVISTFVMQLRWSAV